MSESGAMCVVSIPSKDVYVFFILRRRVQRYRTAVRGGENKNTYTDGTKLYAYRIKYTLTDLNNLN